MWPLVQSFIKGYRVFVKLAVKRKNWREEKNSLVTPHQKSRRTLLLFTRENMTMENRDAKPSAPNGQPVDFMSESGKWTFRDADGTAFEFDESQKAWYNL